MGVLGPDLVVGAILVAFAFPLVGIAFLWFLRLTGRGDGTSSASGRSAYGHDRRLTSVMQEERGNDE